jgi:hypothetical protein
MEAGIGPAGRAAAPEFETFANTSPNDGRDGEA